MSDDLVTMLRDKTEQEDLNTILKTNMGGYTKKSVQEYLSMLRGQQRDLKKAYNEELQRLQAEQARLTEELNSARERAESAEAAAAAAARHALRENSQAKDLADRDKKQLETEAELDRLQDKLTAAQNENLRLREKADSLAEKAEKLEEKAERLEEKADSLADQADKLTAAEQENQRLTDKIARLQEKLTAAQKEKDANPRSAKIQSFYSLQEQQGRELLATDAADEEVVKKLKNSMRRERVLYQALKDARTELDEQRESAECMENENEELTRRLTEQVQENVKLTREITRLKSTVQQLRRRLEELTESRSQKRQSEDSSGVYANENKRYAKV